MRLEHVGDRRVGADADGVCGDRVLALGLDLARRTTFNARDLRATVDASTAANDRVRQAGEILEQMELPLIRKAKTRAKVEFDVRHAIEPRHAGPPDAMRRRQLGVEHVDAIGAAEEEIAVDALEIAVDVFGADDLLDLFDGRAMALHDETRALVAVDVLEHVDAVVHRVGEMRGRAAGFAAADCAVVDDDDFLPGFCEQICGGQSGDSGADDANVGSRISAERRERRNVEGAIPDRSGVAAGKGVVFRHEANSKDVNRSEDRQICSADVAPAGRRSGLVMSRDRHLYVLRRGEQASQ